MSFFKSRKKSTSYNLKGKVQCNEFCLVLTTSRPDGISSRLREFNWLGFILDQIDLEDQEALKLKEGEKYRLRFRIPREFGSMEVATAKVEIKEYFDVVNGKQRLQMDFNIEDLPEIEIIREFVSYRNRRFSRHQSSRRSTKLFKESFFVRTLVIMGLSISGLAALVYYSHQFFFSMFFK